MDALALLCNLHGDGPVTLAALRDVGCEGLAGLEALGDSLLCELLGRDERGVSRFRREARLLMERLDDSSEDVPELGRDGEANGEESPPAHVLEPQAPPEAEPAAAAKTSQPDGAVSEDSGSSPVVSAVLGLWHYLDRAESEGPASNVLAEVSMSGLSGDDVRALDRVGVRTLDELAEADLLALTRRSGLPYTHLAHLAFLARKAGKQERHSDSEGAPGSGPCSVPSEPPEARASEGTAGPFA